jgi:hypothetical protein
MDNYHDTNFLYRVIMHGDQTTASKPVAYKRNLADGGGDPSPSVGQVGEC